MRIDDRIYSVRAEFWRLSIGVRKSFRYPPFRMSGWNRVVDFWPFFVDWKM